MDPRGGVVKSLLIPPNVKTGFLITLDEIICFIMISNHKLLIMILN